VWLSHIYNHKPAQYLFKGTILLFALPLHMTLVEPEFVNLLRSTGIDSQHGGPVRPPFLLHGPPGYIGWLNRFLEIDSCVPYKVYKFALWTVHCTISCSIFVCKHYTKYLMMSFLCAVAVRYPRGGKSSAYLGSPKWKISPHQLRQINYKNIARFCNFLHFCSAGFIEKLG